MKRKRSEYEHYQANNPLTQHYITTGAILPEKKKPPKVVKKRKRKKIRSKD